MDHLGSSVCLAVPRDCLRFVIVVFPDHSQLLFLRETTFAGINLKVAISKMPFFKMDPSIGKYGFYNVKRYGVTILYESLS